jgi:hypothetical protein
MVHVIKTTQTKTQSSEVISQNVIIATYVFDLVYDDFIC